MILTKRGGWEDAGKYKSSSGVAAILQGGVSSHGSLLQRNDAGGGKRPDKARFLVRSIKVQMFYFYKSNLPLQGVRLAWRGRHLASVFE
jgi:hypothetical protein